MELVPAAVATELLWRAATTQRNRGGAPQADRFTVRHPFFSLGNAASISFRASMTARGFGGGDHAGISASKKGCHRCPKAALVRLAAPIRQCHDLRSCLYLFGRHWPLFLDPSPEIAEIHIEVLARRLVPADF
jgi:hypothetical protein